MPDVWTKEVREWAWVNGWDVFKLDDGMLDIQALEEPWLTCEENGLESQCQFEGAYRDFLACAHVYKCAAHQDYTCLKAIRMVMRQCRP